MRGLTRLMPLLSRHVHPSSHTLVLVWEVSLPHVRNEEEEKVAWTCPKQGRARHARTSANELICDVGLAGSSPARRD